MIRVILCLLLMASPALATDYTSRNGPPGHSAMLARSVGPDGLAMMRPVLSGVLYRAGFQGGDKARAGLSQTQRDALCAAGFSEVRYVDFGSKTKFGTTSCGAGRMSYAAASSSKPQEVMQAIHRVIENPASGPILVHCMWGVHSSGALSAMALVQFCGWSEAEAKSYWNDARNNAPCAGGCDQWIDGKFDSFKIDASLSITPAQQRAICPPRP